LSKRRSRSIRGGDDGERIARLQLNDAGRFHPFSVARTAAEFTLASAASIHTTPRGRGRDRSLTGRGRGSGNSDSKSDRRSS
jgi:hypothetical protein